jgi:succinate dehydrogenase/fumarate reductase cytochrome b subunit
MRDLSALTGSRGYSSWAWMLQAASGIVLVVLVTLHMAAQHFSGQQGILGYGEVIAYLRNPVAFLVETVFAGAVIFHALAGVRAILIDLGVSGDGERRLSLGLTVLGGAMFLYSLVLTLVVVTR